jgi:hypothetical protein
MTQDLDLAPILTYLGAWHRAIRTAPGIVTLTTYERDDPATALAHEMTPAEARALAADLIAVADQAETLARPAAAEGST